MLLRLGFLIVFAAATSFPTWVLGQDYEPGTLETFHLDHFESIDPTYNGKMRIRIGIMTPLQGEPLGDVLFLTGFGDRFDNHLELFRSFNRQGLRVITYDYPEHGGSDWKFDRGGINEFGFRKLALLTRDVLRFADRQNNTLSQFPLSLSGWSTGGLLVTRGSKPQA